MSAMNGCLLCLYIYISLCSVQRATARLLFVIDYHEHKNKQLAGANTKFYLMFYLGSARAFHYIHSITTIMCFLHIINLIVHSFTLVLGLRCKVGRHQSESRRL